MNLKMLSPLTILALLVLSLAACTQTSPAPNRPQVIEQAGQPKVIEKWVSSLQVGKHTTLLYEVAYSDGTICSSFINPDDNSIQEECW